MEALPLFFQLIKKNAILYSIITTGSLSNVNLKDTNHIFFSDRAIQFKKFTLGENHVFSFVTLTIDSVHVAIDFTDSNSRYFDSTEYYFGKNSFVDKEKKMNVDGVYITVEEKSLGYYSGFAEQTPSIKAVVKKTGFVDYSVSLRFYFKSSDNANETDFFYVNQFESGKNILALFKPGEVRLMNEYTIKSNSPIIKILVKKKDHPVLKYFESKASLVYQNKVYPHNQIPKIPPIKIQNVRFNKKNSTLEIVMKKGNDFSDKVVSYTTEQPIIKFFDIQGKVMSLKEVKSLKINLQKHYVEQTVLYGKDAFEKYRDEKYVNGVAILIKRE